MSISRSRIKNAQVNHVNDILRIHKYCKREDELILVTENSFSIENNDTLTRNHKENNYARRKHDNS